jgi:DNA-binding MarR family transcriptional regulator
MTLFDTAAPMNVPVGEHPRARKTDPITSHQAAERATVTAGTNRALALLAYLDYGPLTHFELADRTGKAQTSIGVRSKELVTAGLVERAPCKPRPNRDGNPSIVWRLTEEGRAVALELQRGAA